VLLCLALAGCSGGAESTTTIRVVDAQTGEPLPARLELQGPAGRYVVPETALGLTLQCATAPPAEWAAGFVRTRTLDNPHTGTEQFYAAGPIEIALAAGEYRLRVFRGIEWEVAEVAFSVPVEAPLEVALRRWADEPARGWYGADDHLHVTRLGEIDDQRISAWMQAEDLHVANLVQMGTAAQFSVTPQRAFGPEGVVRAGSHLLVPGQEHPRTHFLGHTLTLAAREPIDLRDTYIDYQTTWDASHRLEGVSGYAHWGAGVANDGLAIYGPTGGISFVEVLQFEYPHYAVWYELLDLGLRITPTAGTDFPCGPWSIPGRERFYAQVEGPLSVAAWTDAIRQGRTFVTNGPLLELQVGNQGIGGELMLSGPGPVPVSGSVRFDPSREEVSELELIVSGVAVPLPLIREGPGVIRFEHDLPIDRSVWIALRASGDKLNESPPRPMDLPGWLIAIGKNIANGAQGMDERERWVAARSARPSAAHTAAVFVTVGGAPPIAQQDRARELARLYLGRLDDVSERLSDEQLPEQPIWDWVPYSDGVSEEHLRRNRPALLESIRQARGFYEGPRAPSAAAPRGRSYAPRPTRR
jgi:hypothetical protein